MDFTYFKILLRFNDNLLCIKIIIRNTCTINKYMIFCFYNIRKSVCYRNEVYRYTKQFKEFRGIYAK